MWVGVFSVLAPSQVWTLANYVLTTREAKRSFGFVGSGAILGWIVGGLATRTVVARFGTESMLVFVAVSLILSAGLVVLIWRERPQAQPHGGGRPAAREEKAAGGLIGSLTIVLQSPYLQAIAALVLLSAVATTVAGWQFKAIAKAAIPATDDLAIFFGTFNTVAGLVSLVVQLLLTGRVLRFAGVGTALFIVPVAMISGSAGVLVFGTLASVAMLKASDQVLRYSIDKATIELLYLPVSAAQTFRVKSFIDTVVYRMGDALGGIMVLIFAAGLRLSPVHMAWVGLALTGGWLWAAWVARRQYVENLRESIHQHRVDSERAALPVLDRDTTAVISSRLKGEPDEIAYALSLFEMANDRVVHPAVRGLLRHERPEIRQKAVALLARARDVSVHGEVEELLQDPALEVRTEALLYLSAFEPIDPLERIEELGDFEDFSIRAALVAFLGRPGRAQNLDAARMMLAAMADEDGPEGARTRLEAARLLGGLPDVFDRELRRLVDDEDIEVAKAAIAAVGRLKKRAFVARILERMSEPALVAPVVDALSQLGDRIVGTLRDHLMDPDMPLAVRRQIPAALQAIGTTAAQAALAESVLERDVVLRYNVIAALNKLAQLHPEPLRRPRAHRGPARRRDHGPLPLLPGARHAGRVPDGRRREPGARRPPGVDDEGRRADLPAAQDSASRPRHAQRLRWAAARATRWCTTTPSSSSTRSSAPVMRARVLPLFDRDVKPAQRVEAANRVLGATLEDRE